jgi:hypothetical protein
MIAGKIVLLPLNGSTGASVWVRNEKILELYGEIHDTLVPVPQSHPPNPQQGADVLQGSKNDLRAMFNIHASEYLTIPQQPAALVHHGKRPLWGKVCLLVRVFGKARASGDSLCVRVKVFARVPRGE